MLETDTVTTDPVQQERLYRYVIELQTPAGRPEQIAVVPLIMTDKMGRKWWESADETRQRAERLASLKKDLGCRIIDQRREQYVPISVVQNRTL